MELTKHCLVALLFLRAAAIGALVQACRLGWKGKPMGESKERKWNT